MFMDFFNAKTISVENSRGNIYPIAGVMKWFMPSRLVLVLYCHIHVHAEIYIYMLDTYRRNEQQMQEDFFKQNMSFSFYCKGSKRLCGVLLWEGAGNWT